MQICWADLVTNTLGLGLDLLGVLEHPLVQNQGLAPLLHQHVGLGDKEAPGGWSHGHSLVWTTWANGKHT